jgi:hypothetical protein
MRLRLFAMALGLTSIVGTATAEARPYYGNGNDGRMERSHANWTGARHYSHRQYSHRRYSNHRSSNRQYARRGYSHRGYAHHRHGAQRQYAQRRYGRRTYASAGRSAGGRPRAWCGWWMRTQLGGGAEYNLATNWRHYGRPSGPRVGAVVVWRHHVGIITGRASNGQWVVKSGNDGNRVRERPQSVAGAVFRAG